MAKEKKQKPDHLVARAKAKFTVYPVKEAGELLDFLMKVRDGISRTTAKSFLAHRQVYVNNVITTQYNFALKPGMKVQISKEKGKKEFTSKYLKILYEDAYLLVVDKKEGIATASSKTKERTIQAILNEYVQRSGKQHRVYALNRLDKETSGLLLLAKDEKTRNTFKDNWNRMIKEIRFVAILAGNLEKDNGVVASWLVDDKVYVVHTPVTNDNNEKAITYYKTIKRANGFSLVELELGEGHKNQVRTHMFNLKHPILGEDGLQAENNPLERLALHAFKLNFHHPITKDLMEFKTVYPADFKKIMLKVQKTEE
ncbi:RluA family pseudouridine synthase [Bacteroides sp. OttesenSCG-928-D19]|nr:RluA family pseudouridine synthase [Bacteroides sp. OttesenSCG-928-N06]MDL2305525.1 RluA family pseudouridine synthase [Bacteroides sp. OttesenSCG-928-D19]